MMKAGFRFRFSAAASLFFLILPFLYLYPEPDYYCGLNPEVYLSGRFNPAALKCFISLEKSGIPAAYRPQYMRREAAEALKLLILAFKRDNPGLTIEVRSSTRTFFDQKYIWGKKWEAYSAENPDGKKVGDKILRYSSMPGTSRHHWGTDIDINSLKNSYFESGTGKILLDWMDKNAAQYGFCRPYTAGRSKGYAEERWHWSYKPLSSIFLAGWNAEYSADKTFFYKGTDYKGRIFSERSAPEYVNSINGECR